ncbi:MAG TPA: hypothetical protein VNR41_02760 [Xanthobacteraceae bacterium]|jgi:hypothetical protein|nr:hypothetical protein [Xanthobacteraceae bacterium]
MHALSPELYFALTLIAKMAITGVFLVVATVLAERSGPLVGGLVTTLPISAGPTYFFLAFDHSAQFIADGALITLVFNAVNALFALVYALLAQRHSLAVSIGGALLLWVVSAPILPYLPWTLTSAIIVNVIVILLSLRVTRDLRHTRAPRVPARWYELLLRAAGVALLVGFVVGLSFRIGPAASGMLATFPIVFSSVIVIMHRRAGGPATAAILANALLGMTGFALACIALHVAAVPLGSPAALLLAIAASIGWGLLVFALRKRHMI